MPDQPDVSAQPAVETLLSKYQLIQIAQIKPSRHQARKNFDPEALKGLAESMKQEGLQQPITVRRVGDGYELVSGERRLRAAKLLGWETIEAKVIQTVSEAEASAKGLIENLQRVDLNPIEEAEGFKELQDLNDSHWTHEQIAKVTGKGRTYITESLGLLGLPPTVQENVRHQTLSRSHGIEIARLNNAKSQKRLALKVGKKGLSVMQTRERVDALLAKEKGDGKVKGRSSFRLDPLGNIWPNVEKDQSLRNHGQWSVRYKEGNWNFQVNKGSKTALEEVLADLAQWFMGMGQVLSRKAKDVGKEQKEIDQFVSPQKVVMEKLLAPLHLPKTPEEWAELEALAPQGPGAVAKWICGVDSPRIQPWLKSTWTELGYEDPIKGCREFVKEFKKHPLPV